MRRAGPLGLIFLGATLALASCDGGTRAPQKRDEPGLQTIQQTRDVPALPLPSDTAASASSTAGAPLVDLPFTPAISMDPVDGGKVSIRPDTPVAAFKERVYYFRSEENRQAFLRNPEKYAGGSLSRY